MRTISYQTENSWILGTWSTIWKILLGIAMGVGCTVAIQRFKLKTEEE